MDSGKHGKNWTEIWSHHHFVVVEYASLLMEVSTIDDNEENSFENVKNSDVDDAAPVLALLESDGEDDELFDVE